jgi:hypothetical protein
MRLNELIPKTKTPDRLRLDALKSNKDKAALAMAAERQRQQLAKAQKALTTAKKPVQPKLPVR